MEGFYFEFGNGRSPVRPIVAQTTTGLVKLVICMYYVDFAYSACTACSLLRGKNLGNVGIGGLWGSS